MKAKRPRTPQPGTASQMAPNDRIETVETGAREKTPASHGLGVACGGLRSSVCPSGECGIGLRGQVGELLGGGGHHWKDHRDPNGGSQNSEAGERSK